MMLLGILLVYLIIGLSLALWSASAIPESWPEDLANEVIIVIVIFWPVIMVSSLFDDDVQD